MTHVMFFVIAGGSGGLPTNEHYAVYSVDTDTNGYPRFLIYHNNQWLWKSAKHFSPALLLSSSTQIIQ